MNSGRRLMLAPISILLESYIADDIAFPIVKW